MVEKSPRVATQTQLSICDLSETSSLRTEVQDPHTDDDVNQTDQNMTSRSGRRKNSVPTMAKINLMLNSGIMESQQSVCSPVSSPRLMLSSQLIGSQDMPTEHAKGDVELQAQLKELKQEVKKHLAEVYKMHASLYHEVQLLKQSMSCVTPLPDSDQTIFDYKTPLNNNFDTTEKGLKLASMVAKPSKNALLASSSHPRTKVKKNTPTALNRTKKRSLNGNEPYSASRNNFN